MHVLKPIFCIFLGAFLLLSFPLSSAAQSSSLHPLVLIKTAPTLPIFGDDINLGLEATFNSQAGIELTGGYVYRNPLLFWILSPLGPNWAMPAYEKGWYAEVAFKQYDVFNDPHAYLSYGLRYQQKSYSQEKFDQSWAILNRSENCFVESSTRTFGTFRAMWGKMYPLEGTPLVLEAYGGISFSGGRREFQTHQTGVEVCDGPFIANPEPERELFFFPWFHSGLKVGVDFAGRR